MRQYAGYGSAHESNQRYRISVAGLPGLSVNSEDTVEVAATQSRWTPVRVQLPFAAAPPGSHVIHFNIEAVGSSEHVSEKSVFLVPR